MGTAARAGLLLLGVPGATDLVVGLINVVGAFLLGVVTGAIIRCADTPRARAVRQFLGTGVLGGFTTYSTFAVDAVTGTALWLTLGTAVVGVLAAWLGLALTSRSAAAGRAGTPS